MSLSSNIEPVCWRVRMRICCDACDYPMSEARYMHMKEWKEQNPDLYEQHKETYEVYAAGAKLFGEKV